MLNLSQGLLARNQVLYVVSKDHVGLWNFSILLLLGLFCCVPIV